MTTTPASSPESTSVFNARAVLPPYTLGLVIAMAIVQAVIALADGGISLLASILTAAVVLGIVLWLWRNQRRLDGVIDTTYYDQNDDGVAKQVVVDWIADGIAEGNWVLDGNGQWLPVSYEPIETVTCTGPTPYEAVQRILLDDSHDVLVNHALSYENVWR